MRAFLSRNSNPNLRTAFSDMRDGGERKNVGFGISSSVNRRLRAGSSRPCGKRGGRILKGQFNLGTGPPWAPGGAEASQWPQRAARRDGQFIFPLVGPADPVPEQDQRMEALGDRLFPHAQR